MKVSSAREIAGSSERFPPGVRVGPGALIDDDVSLGETRGRSGPSRGLEIGRQARIRSGCAVHDGVRIGDRLEMGRHVVIRGDTTIGDEFRVWDNTIIDAGCTIGDRVQIHANCYIAQLTTIGDEVNIGPGVCLADDPHPGSLTHLCMRGPTIERGAHIGTNATILPFVTIGERSLVSPGSVVARSVPAGFVVAGNPARILKSVAKVTCPLDVEEGQYLESRRGSSDASRETAGERTPGRNAEGGWLGARQSDLTCGDACDEHRSPPARSLGP